MRTHKQEIQAVRGPDSDVSLKASSTGGEVAPTQGTKAAAHQDAGARADMYRFLSGVYLSPPDEDLLRHLIDHDFLDELAAVFGEQVVAELKDFASRTSIDEDLKNLRQEYMGLFAVPTGRYVTPFEDVYRGGLGKDQGGNGPLLGDRAIAVNRAYRRAGATMDRTCKELPTHVGVELSFMSFLCEREAAATYREASEAAPDGREKEPAESTMFRELQSRFLQEHLIEWFPRLSARIQSCAGKPFYRGLAVVTEEFLSRDASSLLAQTQEQSA
jgi:TorA maturation chaperone TorD